jgi:hypothetical protein
MNERLNRYVTGELRRLEAGGVLTAAEARRIGERYPTGDWNVVSLVRAFTILGALSAAAGVMVLAGEHMNALRLVEGSLAVAIVLLLVGARWVRAKDMPRTAASMEMGAGFAVQGLTTVLAIDFSRGSDNWPSLIGVQTILLVAMAYALRNRLILTHATVMAFVWFGGETGYVSGWGMYWLGMSYPMRFVAAGVVSLGLAWVHAEFGGPFQPFSRVYGHFGALVLNLSLWMMSLFGDFDESRLQMGTLRERLAFTGIWAAVSLASIFTGARFGVGLLRSYGLIFFIINVYTVYFQFIAGQWDVLWWAHLLLAGGSLLFVGFRLERWLNRGEHAS